jgi:hypothetical protein
LHQDEVGEVVKLHEGFQDLLVEGFLLAQVVTCGRRESRRFNRSLVFAVELLTDGCFVESLAFVEELRHILCINFQQMILVEIFDTWKGKRKEEASSIIQTTRRASGGHKSPLHKTHQISTFLRIHVELLPSN